MKNIIVISIFCLCFFNFSNAQIIEFTSTYTDVIGESCYKVESNTLNEAEIPMICGGLKGYELLVYYDFSGHEIINVQTSDPDDTFTGSLSSSYCGDTHQYGEIMEWRLANGKPFACIIRVTCTYLIDDYSESYGLYLERFEAEDEYFVVIGLNGFETIQGEFEINYYNNAQKSARSMAERAYMDLLSDN